MVETTRELELGLRYWPASGVYLSASGGYRWVENAQHVTGDETSTPLGKVEVRLNR